MPVRFRDYGEPDLESTDFYLDMAPEDWEDMLTNIQENGEATFDYTLNTIDLDSENGLALSVHGETSTARTSSSGTTRRSSTSSIISSRVPTDFKDGA